MVDIPEHTVEIPGNNYVSSLYLSLLEFEVLGAEARCRILVHVAEKWTEGIEHQPVTLFNVRNFLNSRQGMAGNFGGLF